MALFVAQVRVMLLRAQYKGTPCSFTLSQFFKGCAVGSPIVAGTLIDLDPKTLPSTVDVYKNTVVEVYFFVCVFTFSLPF
jgi:hypothetical protein